MMEGTVRIRGKSAEGECWHCIGTVQTYGGLEEYEDGPSTTCLLGMRSPRSVVSDRCRVCSGNAAASYKR